MKACNNSSGECLDYYTSAVFALLNIISVIFNTLYIVLLVKILDLKNKNYFWILLNLTMVDIAGATVLAISCLCAIYELLISTETGIGVALIAVGQQSSLMCRYYQLTIACVDRYYAVCKPFDYNTSSLTNNAGKLSALSWIITIIIPIVKVCLTVDKACLGEFSTYEVPTSTLARWIETVSSLFVLIPSILTAVLLIKIARELKRMSQRSNMRSEDKELRSATKYVIGTSIMFYCSLLPIIFGTIINAVYGDPSRAMITFFLTLAVACQTLYGISNVLLYGCLNPSYITIIFRFFSCKTKVAPI